MSARLTDVESNQTEFNNKLSDLVMTSQNNEQELKSCRLALDSLATMVTSIMHRLDSKSVGSPPNHSGGNHDAITRSPPKSTCENQAQSKDSLIGTSSALPVDVVEVSYVPSEDENPPKQSVRVTRSKDAKGKAISVAPRNSEAGMKASRSEKVYRKEKVVRGGGSKGCGNEDGAGQPTSHAPATQEGAESQGGMCKSLVAPRRQCRLGAGWTQMLEVQVWRRSPR